MSVQDRLIIGVDFSDNDDINVVIVSRHTNDHMEIVNAFQGEEATKIYEALLSNENGNDKFSKKAKKLKDKQIKLI